LLPSRRVARASQLCPLNSGALDSAIYPGGSFEVRLVGVILNALHYKDQLIEELRDSEMRFPSFA